MRACPDTWPNFDAQYLGDRPIRAHGTTQFSISAGVIGAAINRSCHSVGGQARANGASRHAVPYELYRANRDACRDDGRLVARITTWRAELHS